jgi:hypothetical protein
MATGVIKRDLSAGALSPSKSERSPILHREPSMRAPMVQMAPLKEFARKLRPDHPLRVVLAEEPEEMDSEEYCVKISIWLRLLFEPAR